MLMAAFATVGCSNIADEPIRPDGQGGSASLIVSIGSPLRASRQLGAEGSAVAGEKMNNLVMLLVEENHICVRVDLTAGDEEFSADQTEAHVVLSNLEVGDHTIYFVANTGSLTTLDLGAYTEGTTMTAAQLAALDDALAGATLTDTALPTYTEEQGMPMTARVEHTLKHGTNKLSAELERVVARLAIVVNNHVLDESLRVVVTNASLSAFNSSQGYLFNHNYTPPTTNTYRSFNISTASRYVENGDVAAIVDDYIYETDASAVYELGLTVGIFNADEVGDTPPSLTEVNSGPDTTTRHYDVLEGHQYFVRNAGNSMYLYVNGSTLRLGNYDDSIEQENYLWVFSGDDSGTIQNVGSGLYITNNNTTLSLTSSASRAEEFTFGTSTNGGTTYAHFRSSYTSSSGWLRNYYFLAHSNNSPALTQGNWNSSPNSNNQRWTLYEPMVSSGWDTTPVAQATHSAPLTIITPEGRVNPLEAIKRNDKIAVGINLFYNPEDGYFNFEVVPWQEGKGGNTTFD